MSRTYTQEEHEAGLRDQREQDAILTSINHRLDEANNYKATIGKDIGRLIDAVNEMKDQQRSYMTKAEMAATFVTRAQLIERGEKEVDVSHDMRRDRWLRYGVVLTAIGIFLTLTVNILQDFKVLPH